MSDEPTPDLLARAEAILAEAQQLIGQYSRSHRPGPEPRRPPTADELERMEQVGIWQHMDDLPPATGK